MMKQSRLGWILFVPLTLTSQAPPTLTITDATFARSPRTQYIFVQFSAPILAEPPINKDNATLQGASDVQITSVTPDLQGPTFLDVVLDRALPQGSTVRLCFASLSYRVNGQ